MALEGTISRGIFKHSFIVSLGSKTPTNHCVIARISLKQCRASQIVCYTAIMASTNCNNASTDQRNFATKIFLHHSTSAQNDATDFRLRVDLGFVLGPVSLLKLWTWFQVIFKQWPPIFQWVFLVCFLEVKVTQTIKQPSTVRVAPKHTFMTTWPFIAVSLFPFFGCPGGYIIFLGDTPALTAIEHQNSHTFGLPGGQTFFRFDLWYLHCGLLSFGPCHIGDNSFRIGRWEMLEIEGWFGRMVGTQNSG